MLGREARARGFNVLLGRRRSNLARDPRNGRNFEYLSEDPLLSAVLAAESITGIQGEGVISTIKHFTLNCNETNRHWLDAIIDPAAHRESDLLAFEIAIERSQPGSVMTRLQQGQRRLRGRQRASCSNEVLKGAWGYQGWVMSDWGATPSWEFALEGLDQESGDPDRRDVLGRPSRSPSRCAQAYADGKLPKERLSDMVRRILRSIYAVGVDAWGPAPAVDHGRAQRDRAGDRPPGHRAAQERRRAAARRPTEPLRIAVIGGYAQLGVAERHRLGRGPPGRRLRGGDPDRRRRASWGRPKPVPHAVVAARPS